MKPLSVTGKPVAYMCSYSGEIQTLVDESKKFSDKESFVLLIDHSQTLISKLVSAYLNAVVRRNDSAMRASSIQLEMLLLLSSTMKISDAISNSGAKDSKKFVFFATDEKLASRFIQKSGIKVRKKVKLEMNPGIAQEVAMTELLSER